jgi:hypothetical protein
MSTVAFLSAVPSLLANCEKVQLGATQVLKIVQQGHWLQPERGMKNTMALPSSARVRHRLDMRHELLVPVKYAL